MSQFQDRVAVITGGSRGIGRAIALELAGRGANIAIVDLSDTSATVAEIAALGVKAKGFQADVSKEEPVEEFIKGVLDEFEKIDILVNNAGITRDNLIMRMPAEEFDLVMAVNLRSAWLCSKAVTRPMMRKRYGRIINMASVSGVLGQAGQTNYSASKAGLIGMTKALARELASRNITVNAIAPGFIETALTKDLPEDIKAQLDAFIPLKRWGQVEDIAKAAAFLASDDASYITGHVLKVDGGMAI